MTPDERFERTAHKDFWHQIQDWHSDLLRFPVTDEQAATMTDHEARKAITLIHAQIVARRRYLRRYLAREHRFLATRNQYLSKAPVPTFYQHQDMVARLHEYKYLTWLYIAADDAAYIAIQRGMSSPKTLCFIVSEMIKFLKQTFIFLCHSQAQMEACFYEPTQTVEKQVNAVAANLCHATISLKTAIRLKHALLRGNSSSHTGLKLLLPDAIKALLPDTSSPSDFASLPRCAAAWMIEVMPEKLESSSDLQLDVDAYANEHSSSAYDPARIFEQQEQMREAMRIISQLPERTRRAFLLSKFDGRTESEIAALMSTSVGNVRGLIGHAKKRIEQLKCG